MPDTALLSTTYFGPVQWYQKLYRYDRCLIEQYDSYQKQTYRNRCRVMTANGVDETVRFSKIRSVGKNREQNLITMSGLIMHHMVYVDDENFDFVYDFICQHCTNARIKA